MSFLASLQQNTGLNRLVRQIPDGCSHSAAKAALTEIGSQRGWRCDDGRGGSTGTRWRAGDKGEGPWEIELRGEPPGGWGGEGVARVGLGFTETPYFLVRCPTPNTCAGAVLLVQAATEYRDFLRAVDSLPCAGDGVRPAWVRLWTKMVGIPKANGLTLVEEGLEQLRRAFLVLAEGPPEAVPGIPSRVVETLSRWAQGYQGDGAPAVAHLGRNGIHLAVQPRRGSAPSDLASSLTELCQALSAPTPGA